MFSDDAADSHLGWFNSCRVIRVPGSILQQISKWNTHSCSQEPSLVLEVASAGWRKAEITKPSEPYWNCRQKMPSVSSGEFLRMTCPDIMESPAERTRNEIITLSWSRNDDATSFRRNDGVITALCVRWVTITVTDDVLALNSARPSAGIGGEEMSLIWSWTGNKNGFCKKKMHFFYRNKSLCLWIVAIIWK